MHKLILLKSVCTIFSTIICFLSILKCSCNTYAIVGAGTNKQHQTTKNTAKLDRENEELKHDKIPLDVGKIIQQGRQSKGLSQKDLATVSGFCFYRFSLGNLFTEFQAKGRSLKADVIWF